MKTITAIIVSVLIAMMILPVNTYAVKKVNDQIQRDAIGVFDNQINTVSNFQVLTSNFGIFGSNVKTGLGGGFWPRGSQNEYLFGGGFWFGSKRNMNNSDTIKKYVEVSYNPNNGNSWFVPGMVQDGDTAAVSDLQKYRVYFSTDLNKSTAKPLKFEDGPNWPLWITDTTGCYEFGTYKNEYVNDTSKRNWSSYPAGPLFVSSEDIVSIYKDTDLNHFDGGKDVRKFLGYPLGLQVEQEIYSWGNDSLKDVLIIGYKIKNISNDTLRDCWFGKVDDVDITLFNNAAGGATNDRCRFFAEDPTLNLAVAWTNIDQGELGKGFGYIGISLVESPAVDKNGFIRHDKLLFDPSEQLRLKTFRNWVISQDYIGDDERYDFISSQQLDNDDGPGDKRMLLATGSFNMLPGDIARVVIAYNFALPYKGGEADGTTQDLAGLLYSTKKDDNSHLLGTKKSLVGNLKIVRNAYYNSIAMAVNDPANTDNTFNIKAVYPNPASNTIDLQYELQNPDYITISLVNILGSDAGTLYNGFKPSGVNTDQYNLNNLNLPSGSYFIKISSGSSVKYSKVVIEK